MEQFGGWSGRGICFRGGGKRDVVKIDSVRVTDDHACLHLTFFV